MCKKPNTLSPVDVLRIKAQAPANVFVISRSLTPLYAYLHERLS